MKSSIMKMSGLALLLIGMASCGGSENTFIEEINVKAKQIDGEFGESIKIKSKDVLVRGSYTTKCMVEIEVIDYEDMEGYEAILNLHLLSKDGDVLSKMDMDYYQREQLTRMLADGKGTMKVSFNGYDRLSEQMTEFSIETSWKELKNENSNNTKSDSKNESSSSIDDMLDSYDDYMDSYVSLAKKMQKDPSNSEILSEYTEYMNKTADLAKKLEKCKDDMSSAQIQRMIKIQSRMASAIK